MILLGGGGGLCPTLFTSLNSMPTRPGKPLTKRLILVGVLACTNRDSPKPMSWGKVSLADKNPCTADDA